MYSEYDDPENQQLFAEKLSRLYKNDDHHIDSRYDFLKKMIKMFKKSPMFSPYSLLMFDDLETLFKLSPH
jgi:hypothetical protein